MKNYNDRLRKKAFLGAVIGAVGSIAGSAISSASRRKQAEREARMQNFLNAQQVGVENAMNLTNAYNNYDTLNKEFKDRFYKYGGCRKKAKWGVIDTQSTISGIGSMFNNIIDSSFTPKTNTVNNVPLSVKPIVGSNTNAVYNSANKQNMLNDYYYKQLFKYGGRRHRH